MNKFLICALLALSFAGNSTVHAIPDRKIAHQREKRLEGLPRSGIDTTTITRDNYNKTFSHIYYAIYRCDPLYPDLANNRRRGNEIGACNEEFEKFENKTWKDLIASRSADDPRFQVNGDALKDTTAALKKMWTAD